MYNSFTKGSYYIKSDLESKNNLFDEEGNLIFSGKSNFEVKKMDPFIDSYLSEFFSIFKESNLKIHKKEYLSLYNKLIDRIYVWLTENKNAISYLEKVKSQIAGIIYENNLIVPIENIDLYWSNKGQRGCLEKRLSIRFRIKPNIDVLKAYRYRGNGRVVGVVSNVPKKDRNKIICEK